MVVKIRRYEVVLFGCKFWYCYLLVSYNVLEKMFKIFVFLFFLLENKENDSIFFRGVGRINS